MSKIKLVILDIDDTLYLTEQISFDTENRIAVKMGFAPMSREVHLSNWGKRIQEAIAERIPGIDVPRFMNLFIKENEKLVKQGKLDSLSPSNLETLTILKNMGKIIAIVTSRTYGEVKHLLEGSHPLQDYISDFFYDGNLKYLKPDPRVFDQLLKQYGASPKETVYVGDSVSDANCAANGHIHFIATLESGIRCIANFDEVSVDHFIERFSDLPKCLDEYK